MRELLAKEQIRDRLASLARGEDRRDAALVHGAFWPDATVDFGMFAGDFDAYLAWVVPGSSAIPVTQHVLGQSLIRLDGSAARVETHVLAYHRVDMGSGHRDVVLGGRYLDTFAERDGQWRIAQRTMLYDWHQDVGVSADWTNGMMGAPFTADHYAGRAVDDHSAAFFAT
jgi:hypothetical protein